MGDSVPEEVKSARTTAIVEMQRTIALDLNRRLIGTVETVLVEGPSKKSDAEFMGRTDTNKTVIFPRGNERAGDLIDIVIERANAATLFGEPVKAGEHTEGEAA
jgi:tRNA-2-methylthio-N6-dimethylallyladenosine synthase